MNERERFRKAAALHIAVKRCKTLTAAKVLINDFIRTGEKIENRRSNPRWLDKKLAQIEQLEKNNQAKKVKSLNERDSSRLSA